MATSVILGYHTEKKKCYVFTLNIENEKDILESKVKLWHTNQKPGNPEHFGLTYSNTSIRLPDELSRCNQNTFLTPFHLFYFSDINFEPKPNSYKTQLISNYSLAQDDLKLICLGEISGITSYEHNKNLELSILYELAKSSITKFHCFQTNFY